MASSKELRGDDEPLAGWKTANGGSWMVCVERKRESIPEGVCLAMSITLHDGS